ncbi:MAG: aminomethyl-transferring glycine dehydrogenase [Bacteroidota bacterium]
MNLFEEASNEFFSRHIGTIGSEAEMLAAVGCNDIEDLISKTIPDSIRLGDELDLPAAISEAEMLHIARDLGLKNKVFRSYIGQGYYDTVTPSVILRNVFENPGWYTQYTPYQAEISQGRLESLLNFQTIVSDLTSLPIANASLLDEATAGAEAMNMLFHHVNRTDIIKSPKFFVDENIFPQTKSLLITRAVPIGIELVFGKFRDAVIDETYFGALVQYPAGNGDVIDFSAFINEVHQHGGYVAMATDLLALTLLTPPGELGADVAFGSAQRLGVPLGYGGPHAAFFAVKDDFKRAIPGRIIGVSVDAAGSRALRMALQTREQHIKREKATSNICTAQALLANMAAMYVVYHGPEGIRKIAQRIHLLTAAVNKAFEVAGIDQYNKFYFDTLHFNVSDPAKFQQIASTHKTNFRYFEDGSIGISLDEAATAFPLDTVHNLESIFKEAGFSQFKIDLSVEAGVLNTASLFKRESSYLLHPNFNTHHSESQMMRYIKQLENKDLSLNTSMISLGSCTMKLNAATQMIPLSWASWNKIHPFAPVNQAEGYHEMMKQLSKYLCTITGFDECWLQPNSGAQGEYAGLLAIRNYHLQNGDTERDIILIPISAHGTNPASAVMAGMKVVVVKALQNGYIDEADFKAKAEHYGPRLAGTMITYPSTYGVFEESVKELCAIVHAHGGQVYMDGANMNAQVGLTSPAAIGADVCHLNLHKTFSIPHGGGGPGMGPICFKSHLSSNFMTVLETGNDAKKETVLTSHVSAAPFGSASILLISYAYIRLLGVTGVKLATQYAILNANYMRAVLQDHFDILYLGHSGTCAHEFIIDLRPFKSSAAIEAEDVAKRLMDYGFHAPTLSFPVPGTIMIEPTESEDKAELDRFCDALIAIRKEIAAIENGNSDKLNNPLKNAPHTQREVMSDQWNKPYSRETAAFPLPYVIINKFWPSIGRVNNTYGDRNLVCTCEPVSSYMDEAVHV